jgi:hypothetical protein
MKYIEKYYVVLLILAFTLSVLIRIPNLNRPLSKHHEFNAAMILNVCKSWDIAGGPHKHHFTPIIFYGNKEDSVFQEGANFHKGKNYYVSMGALQFLLPYYFFKLTHLAPSPLHLQIFAIVIGMITATIFFGILSLLFKHKKEKIILSFLGTLIFIFLHNNLWFFSNAFSHESLALPFYFLWIKYMLQSMYADNKIKTTTFFYLASILFIGVYTDWLLLVCGCITVLYFLFVAYTRKTQKELLFAFGIITALLFSAGLIYYTYSSELSANVYWRMLKDKFFSRTVGGNTEQYSMWKIIKQIGLHILLAYGLLLAIGFTKRISITFSKPVFIVSLPVLFYSLSLIQFTAENDYALLKWSLVAIVLFLTSWNAIKSRILKMGMVVLVVSTQIGVYFYVNKVGATSRNGDAYNAIKQLAVKINQMNTKGAYIFTFSSIYNYPALMYYTHRNISFFKDSVTMQQLIDSTPAIQNYILIQQIGNEYTVAKIVCN